MGRKKLEIKKIKVLSGRKNKFSMRCPGVIKKAYELSVLTVTDGVLITSNPSDDKLSYFSLIRWYESSCDDHSFGVTSSSGRFEDMFDRPNA